MNVLLLDENNPRYTPSENQTEAFDKMLSGNEKKVRNIAYHISQNGFNPSTVVIVFLNDEGKYIVKDGNRRITAIKAMMHPSKIHNNPKLKKYMTQLGERLDRKNFAYIECRVFDDEAEANKWVRINHQGSQDGIGQDDWGAIPKARDRYLNGNPEPALKLFEHLQEILPNPVDEDSFPFSTFERVFDFQRFKERLGIVVVDNEVQLTLPEDETIRNFSEIFNDIMRSPKDPNRLDPRAINSVKDVEDYVDRKVREGFLLPPSSKTETPTVIPTKTEIKTSGKGTRKNSGRQKTRLVDSDCEMVFPKIRMNDLFSDMKSIDLKRHTNSMAVVFRAFLEMTSKYYYNEVMGIDRKTDLKPRLDEIAKSLRSRGLISEDVVRALKVTSKDQMKKDDCMIEGVAIALEFNQFGHNYELNPSPESLKSNWDSIKTLFEAMSQDILSKERDESD